MRTRIAKAESFLPPPPEGATKAGPPEGKQRDIPKNFPFDPKALKPMARTVWACSVALGHALAAYRAFNRVKSSSVSPDGMLGGRGYVLGVKDVRKLLFEACENISAVVDTLHDEVNAPHWKPKLADLDANSAEDILHLLDEADETMQDPEEEADEGMEDIESENDGPDGTSTKERFGDKEPGSKVPGGGNVPEDIRPANGKPFKTERVKQASHWDITTYPEDSWANLPGGPRVTTLDRNLMEGGPGGSANKDEPTSEQNRERTRSESDSNKGITFHASAQKGLVSYSQMPDGSLEPSGTVDDFGLGYGAKGPDYAPPKGDGTGVIGPTSGLPSGPPASKVNWDSDTMPQVERAVSDSTKHAETKLPQDVMPPVARAGWGWGGNVNAESVMPSGPDALGGIDTDLPGASGMYDQRDTAYRRWDFTPGMKTDPLHNRK